MHAHDFSLFHVSHQESICDDSGDFQQLVLSVLKEELVPDGKVIKVVDGSTLSPYFKVLDEVSNVICSEVHGASAKHKFCWRVITSFCSRLCLSCDLQWVCSCALKLSYIYVIYCKYYNIPKDRRLLINEDVDAIEHLHSVDMKK